MQLSGDHAPLLIAPCQHTGVENRNKQKKRISFYLKRVESKDLRLIKYFCNNWGHVSANLQLNNMHNKNSQGIRVAAAHWVLRVNINSSKIAAKGQQ